MRICLSPSRQLALLAAPVLATIGCHSASNCNKPVPAPYVSSYRACDSYATNGFLPGRVEPRPIAANPYAPPPPAFPSSPPPSPYAPPALPSAPPSGTYAPPPALPSAPPPGASEPPPPLPRSAPPTPTNPSNPAYPIPSDSRSTPPPPLAVPDQRERPPQEPGVRLYTPEPLGSNAPERASYSSPPPPLGTQDGTPTPSLPVGIAAFNPVIPGRVSNGLRPHSTDGVAWLKTRGYKAVLHLRAPSEQDDVDRRLMEKAGFKYLSLTVSANSLNPEIASQFTKLVGTTDNQPLFVYDSDGLFAGTLWYLHFRLHDGLTTEKAKAQAESLGLKESAGKDYYTFWAAAQRVLTAAGALP